MVAYSQDDGSVLPGRGQYGQALQAVFVLGLRHINPRVEYVDLRVVALQRSHDIDDFRIAHVWAVFFEGQSQYEDLAAQDRHVLAQHQFDDFVRNMVGHVVVDAAASLNDLRVITDFHSLVRQVIRVHANAVPAHQSRTKRQKIPFGARCLQYLECVDAQPPKNQAEFIHQCDVYITLRVFDYLGGFGYLDAAGLVGAGRDDLAVQLVHKLGYFRRAAAGHLLDAGQAVLLVARIDSLRAVAAEEVDVKFFAAEFFEYRYAHFLGSAGIYRGLEYDDRAVAQYLADRFAGLDERGQVGPVGAVHGCRHGHDKYRAVRQVLGRCGKGQLVGFLQFIRRGLQRAVVPGLQFGDALFIDVEADDSTFFAELDCKREADVT